MDDLDFDDPKFLELAAQHDKERAKSMAKKRKEIEPTLSSAELERRNREETLNQPLAANNIGRLMLKKLGYTEGQSLGLQERGGLIEPLAPVQRSKRRGLDEGDGSGIIAVSSSGVGGGSDAGRGAAAASEFRDRKASAFKQKHDQIVASKAFEVCATLDEKAGVELSKFARFAPSKLREQQQQQQQQQQHETTKRATTACCTTNINDDDEALLKVESASDAAATPTLNEAIDYLRTRYRYCVFCSTRYKDNDDLESNCPGKSEADHED